MNRLEVCERRCNQCLFSDNRVVDEDAVPDIIAGALKKDTWFTCHKGSLSTPPRDLVCRGFYDKYKTDTRALRLAVYLKIVDFVPVPEPEKQ